MAENKVTVQNADEQQTAASQHNKKITCGLVMPISSNDCGTEQHWLNVQKIIRDGLLPLDMNIRMVSHSDEVNIIQKNIVRNLFSDDIIICDVSSRNPNVMFELGIRLTFDKPVVIIKDKETPFVFDVGGIYHLEYPRSLNYVDILSFQESLCEKVKATLLASKDENHSPFLSNFTIAIEKKNELSTKEFERDEYLRLQVDELKEMFKIVLSRLPENPIARRNGLTIGGNPVNVVERRNESESVINSYINKCASDIIGQIARNDELTKDASEIVKYCMKYFDENIPGAPDTIRDQIVRTVLTNL
ncbi:hypothetical protein [Aeromonas hydrophila]|uniref:hypothetical protein n=1 Tax=Aeromonas hydrophila TaxID=644 RepID=UPI001A91B49C|nr:hypothetical protein [Aeromonas hydrophila]MBO0407442.1 hypothetical protein [Aeromonas hydrophila]